MAKNLNGKGKQIQSLPAKSRGLGFIWLPMGLLLALSAGALTGVIASYYLNNSRYTTEVSALAHYRPSTVTKIYANDNETVIGEFAIQRRMPIKEKDIPQRVEDALLAVEDIRFYNHIGVDPYRMVGVVVKYFSTGRTEGASTLTQQLARGLFLTNEQTFDRKFREWMLALQIERFYTKRQILEMYMNHIFMGANSYGFEAASQTYFKKPLKDLSIEEAALLAAIPKSGSEYAPTRNMEKATDRRNLVIDQMVKYGKITEAEGSAAKAKPIKLADTAYYQSQPKSAVTDYPVEDIRKYLEDKYTTRVAQGGLQVYTTIDVEAQKLATKVVRERLRAYDRGRPWRSEYQDILIDDENNPITDPKAIQSKLNIYKHPDWYGDDYETDDYVKGLVMGFKNGEAEVRFGRYTAMVGSGNMGRAGKSPQAELKVGFLPEFHIKKVDAENKKLEVELSQVPQVQAAITTINAKTGEIVAMVGGYDFPTNKFNCATQALRQTGSAYKPFVYAAAVEWGITPDMLVSGAPIKKGGWMPHNFDGSLSHPNVPMKVALAKSYNLAAVHLLEMVGVQTGVQMVRRFGITNPMVPALPSALGASEASLIDMVSAYSVFPNKGIRMQPHLIRKVLNRDGTTLEEFDKEKGTSKVTSEYVASTMADMMRGVVSGGGTAGGASAGGHPLAGKTGTVNDHTDVWFIGFTPTYVTGVWMGNPERKESLGSGMTGGHGAVPFFNGFMIPFMKDKPRDTFPTPPPMPTDIKTQMEQRKREELEKLEKAEAAGRSLGVGYTDGVKGTSEITVPVETGDGGGGSETPPATTGDGPPKTGGDDGGKPPEIKRQDPPTMIKKPELQPDKPAAPAGSKKKGKKGGDDN